MKKSILIFSILTIALSAHAIGGLRNSNKKGYVTPEQVHVTISPAAQQKAEDIYESVRKDYVQGKLTADGVVDKAMYHKIWSPQLAARCLQLVADKNNRAKAELGYLYTFHKTAYMFPNKDAEGLSLMEAAANAGYKKANDYLGIYYNNKKDYNRSWKYFKAATPDNIPFALTVMGEMYEKGRGVKKDLHQAREYFRRAAMLGDPNGASKYGMALQRQWYGDVNMPDAFFWTYIAGDLGNDAARSNLQLPLRGERFGDDQNTAFIRNSFALADGFNDQVGHPLTDEPIYQQGYKPGVIARGVAAEKGDVWSLFYLGSMSYNDEFLNHSGDFIRQCYEPLIASGGKQLPDDAMALVYERMSDLYSKGDGVKADPARAAEYARKAADLGSLKAFKIIEKIPD